MTSTFRLFVNTTCTKFNECCKAYPRVNTSLYTERSYKGTNKSDGLNYKKSKSGRETWLLCPQLGEDHSRPMGLAGDNRVSVGIYPDSIPNEAEPRNKVLCSGTCQDNTGGPGPSDKRGCSKSGYGYRQLCLPIFLVQRKGGQASNKSQRPQQLCEGGTLQDGGSPHSSRPNPVTGLDGEIGPKGCIPAGANSPGPSTLPPISMGAGEIPVCMPALWANISTTGVQKNNETSGGGTEADGDSPHSISGRYPNTTSREGRTGVPYSLSLSDVRSPGVDSQYGQITTDPNAGYRIPGVSSQFSLPAAGLPNREIAEDSAGCLYSAEAAGNLSERLGEVCWEDHSIGKSHLASPTTLQGTAENDQLCGITTGNPEEHGNQIQYEAETYQGSRDQSPVVSLLGQEDKTASPTTCPDSKYDNRVRRLHHGLGSTSRGSPNRGQVVRLRGLEPHQLPGAASSLLGDPVLCEAGTQHQHYGENGQCHSSDIYKQNGGTYSLDLCQLALSMWAWCWQQDIYLMAEHLPGKENLVADEESRMMKDRCDWMLNPAIFNQIQLQMGPCEIDLFASCLTRQLPTFYSWRPDPEAENTDAFSQNWSSTRGFANPSWCLIPRALSQAKQQQARVIMITPLWVTQPWYPTILEILEDYPRLLSARQDLVILPTPQDEFIMKQGIPDLVAWPISGTPSHHEEFLRKLQTSSCPPGGQRLKQTMTLCLPNGLLGISKGIEIPLLDL